MSRTTLINTDPNASKEGSRTLYKGREQKEEKMSPLLFFPCFCWVLKAVEAYKYDHHQENKTHACFFFPIWKETTSSLILKHTQHRKKSNIKHVSIKEEEAVVFFPFAWQRRSKKHFGVSSPVTYQKAQYSTTLVSVWFYPIGYWHVLHFCHNHNLGKTCWWG